jgi:hypothetical protein
MDDDQLRASVLATLDMTDATKEEQDEALYRVESIAHKRLALAIPEMLTDEQATQVDAMEAAGKDQVEIMDWVQSQLPQYDEMIRAIIEDVADEVAEM